MFGSGRRRLLTAAVVVSLVVTAAACSSSGGKKAEEAAAGGAAAGQADTPQMTIAMITHAAPGDTFWDIIRKGAKAAAAKDNVDLKYSSDPTSGNQANLIQNAIDSKVDGIAVTLPEPPALIPAVKKAIAAGIPVVALQRGHRARASSRGALSYFGQDETDRRRGRRASEPPRAAPSTSCASSRSRARSSSRPAATA